MTFDEYYEGMLEHFNLSEDTNDSTKHPRFYLTEPLLRKGILTLDLSKFDKHFLKPQFGEYTRNEGKSINNVITENFGDKAASFIKEAIKIHFLQGIVGKIKDNE